MLRVKSKVLALIFLAGLPVLGFAQASRFTPVPRSDVVGASAVGDFPAASLNGLSIPHVQSPIMAPELALQSFQSRDEQQNAGLRSYTDETLVMAELPDTSQRGAFELQRSYVAPHSLSFKPLSFTGDTFVKSNVIVRLLQSEVDYVNKGDARQEALTAENYKFSYKGDQNLDGREVHVFQVKPRHKRAGLFKGHIYLDAYSGSLVRSEGTVVKSPSFFIRKIEFVQDYADVARFTLPVHLHTTARARFVGRAVVDVFHRQYHAQPLEASLALNQVPAGQP
jgi:hypothetical protein